MKTVRELGSGPLATVHEGRTDQGKRVAVKQFSRQTMENSFTRDRILAAANSWQGLQVNGLVHYLDVNKSEGCVTMELMPRSAASRLRNGSSPPPVVWNTLRGALQSLAALHERGFIHGNLKPNNLFFDHDSGVLLSDGLLIPSSGTGTLPPPTTQKYLSPEETNDSWGRLSPATDLYCIGFIALELLAAERFGRAYQGVGDAKENDIAWFQWHASATPAPAADHFHRSCPPELTRVLAKLLAKNPLERYQSAQQALADMPADLPTGNSTDQDEAPEETEATEASVSHIIPRPKNAVVFYVGSGPRAGELFGTDAESILIGYGQDCDIIFSSEQYPHSNAKLNVHRRQDGWYAERVAGEMVFVNQEELDDFKPLRSGDVLRLSARGPDVQFTLQSGGKSLDELVALLLPTKPDRTAPNRPRSAAPKPATPQPAAPQPTAPVAAAPSSPPAASVAPAPPTPAAVAPTAPERPSAPSPPQHNAPQRPDAQPNNDAGRSPSEPVKAAAATGMSKNQTNTLIAVVGGILVLILVILFPTGGSDPESDGSDATEQVDPAQPDNVGTDPEPAVNE